MTDETAAPKPDDYLAEFVRQATGLPDALPRPGQQDAYTAVCRAFDARGQFAAALPTGSGKSAIALAAAAWRAIEHGERTIISTESLSLLTQIVHKDGPTMATACEALGVRPVHIAAHKGLGNYADPKRLYATTNALAGTEGSFDSLTLGKQIGSCTMLPVTLDGPDVRLERLVPLVRWALEQYDDADAAGDRHSYLGEHSAAEWGLVSARSSKEAAKADDTPYYPKAIAARDAAADADIIITNHTMLAIQAANALPVVNGSGMVGLFENIIVDEAHALADEVRARGASEVSGRTLISFASAVSKLSTDTFTQQWADNARVLAEALESRLAARLPRGGGAVKIEQSDNPFDGLEEHLAAWVGQSAPMLRKAAVSPVPGTALSAVRASERADELKRAIDSISEHHTGEARWVEADERPGGQRWTSAQSSPVDVASRIRRNLWNLPLQDEEPIALGVLAMSATLPSSFQFDVGLSAPVVSYPSPFTDAYGGSALFIPAVTQATAARDLHALTSEKWGKQKFDTARHAAWAADRIVELVAANGGRALVLAAKGADGKLYAEAIRHALPELAVLSQWDGATPAALLNQWREEETSVLVGTRGLMTGVDAPGQTCSLVILDRIPRSPTNPCDDARVENVMQRLSMDKWSADRLVYAADATLLMEQAVGRLIRSSSDRGMVAVLDPRLVKTEVGRRAGISYAEPTRLMYASPLRKFGRTLTDTDAARDWLHANRAAHDLDHAISA